MAEPFIHIAGMQKVYRTRGTDFLAISDVSFDVAAGDLVSLVGPSGCGKTTLLKILAGLHPYDSGVLNLGSPTLPFDPSRDIGMVFQQPNPFATTIFNNVAFGLRINNFKGNKAEKVEQALKRAALWDEVKDKLNNSGLSLSGGQQQRLCIARAVATDPEVLLMDEPCSALDPIATRRIEELMLELKERYTIAIVTHNLQQAQRVADETGFLYVDTTQGGRTGYLVEFGNSKEMFENPKEKHTREYIRGEFS